ncbi:MAG: two-component sensor histidine kinase [Chitinophagaceae bacterium]|nr:MAG: two-component sensor histidine kinase [Chitinophagaceae bacterium]
MTSGGKGPIRLVTLVFWVLLFYIIAALLWWLISLERQNAAIRDLYYERYEHLRPGDAETRAFINFQYQRNFRKYIYEGATFLLLILFGAVYIYRLVRRQFRLQQQQQNFMMAITHELKTPLSVARLNLETLQRRQLQEEQRQRLMGATLQETLRLDTLINNILLSSQLDDDAYRLTREEVDFSTLVHDVLQAFSARYPDRPLQADVAPDTDLRGDPLLLGLLVSNLVENANKYAPKGTPIYCRLSAGERGPVLEVRDEGPGVPDDEKKRVFEKFYRVGNEQTRRTKGTGLGLFICSRIARAHDAAISLTDNAPTGATFTVRFKAS